MNPGDKVKRYAELRAQIAVVEGMRDRAVADIASRYAAELGPLEAELALVLGQVEAWAADARNDWEGKCCDFPHGRVRYRLGPKRLVFYAGWDEGRSLAAALEKPKVWGDYIKWDPVLDKRELLAAAEGLELKKIGLRVVAEEAFSIEVPK
jgi:phage host-nuclease inhibitor protein Gam